MDTTQEKVGASIRALSAAFGDKQEDLAKVLDVSQNTISKKLRGLVRWSLADVDILAGHYGVRPEQILAGPRSWLGLADHDGGDTVRYQSLDEPAMAA